MVTNWDERAVLIAFTSPVVNVARVSSFVVIEVLSVATICYLLIAVPFKRAAVPLVLFVGLAVVALVGIFPWFILARRAARAAGGRDSDDWFIFAHGHIIDGRSSSVERMTLGWLVCTPAGISLRYGRVPWIFAPGRQLREIKYAEIETVASVPATKLTPSRVRMMINNDVNIEVVLVPSSGLELQVGKDSDTGDAIHRISQYASLSRREDT